MADNKLVGQNYLTPDLLAKVTGKAKYAEDYRAEGMLWTKLLLSPMPHARVTRLDLAAATALPGVVAILTADELPTAADVVTDLGAVIKANVLGERALTNEPVYFGEPILAVAAVDELTAAEAIERIQIEFEPLPFAVDPLVSLSPDGPDARLGGNTWGRPEAAAGAPPPPLSFVSRKWTESDFAATVEGQLPMGQVPDEWSHGDLEAGFRDAVLVLDETFISPNNHHQTLETRSTLAYWQNGKAYVHCSTQSVAQTAASLARWLHVDVNDVVVISEYCGGGFGSKVTGTISSVIPALLAKKAGVPVMMRVDRETEHGIGGARPSLHGRIKAGFSKDGRLTALDMFVIADNGPYEANNDASTCGRMASLVYQPQAMRWRGITVLTNTSPRRAQSQPGGMQASTLMEHVLSKAARQLGIDQVAMRRVNAPAGKAEFGPPRQTGQRPHATSAFVREALDRGAEQFKWQERSAANGRRDGTKVRGVGVAVSGFVAGSNGFDGLLVVKPDGRLAAHCGIGNLGTASVFDVHRVAAQLLGIPWDRVDVVWGNTSTHLPWTSIQGGSQTIHAMTRAAHAAASDAVDKLTQIAAAMFGGAASNYSVRDGEVVGNGRRLSLAAAATKAIELGGRYDGHELPETINSFTATAAKGLAGTGLIGVAKDTYPQDGQTHSFVVGFAEVEVDVETGKYAVTDYLAVGDVGTVVHPRSLGGQLLGRSMLGIGHAISQKTVFDQHYGVPLATRFYQNRPPTILDVPARFAWEALDLADPETPVGARGVGEPPVGAGCNAVLNALSAALGDKVFRRAPVTLDVILESIEAGRPMDDPLTAHI